MIEMRDGRKPVISPQLKSVSNYIDVSFVSGELPIGTPTSPFIHHLLMKDFDDLAKRIAPFSLRYADDNFLAFYTKEDANCQMED